MDWLPFVTAVTGLLLAGIIKGATGLGYASCALPFLVATLGLKPAMALVIVPAMATNVSVALNTGYLIETATRFRVLYAAMIPGIAVGINLLLWVDQDAAVKTLGAGIVAYVLLALSRPKLSMPARLESFLQFPTGFMNGVMTGLTGAQVMPLFPYMMALNLDPSRMVQAINLAVLIASSFLAVGLIATGVMTPMLLGTSILALAPALFGVEIGTRARQYIPVEHFRRIALMTLMLMGILMLMR
jgi:uncharacterized protein